MYRIGIFLFVLGAVLCALCANVHAESGTVRGHISNGESTPLKGVIVELYDIRNLSEPAAANETDADGFYAVALENGTYRMRIIGGSSSWIYMSTGSDYFRDIAWHPRQVEIAGGSVVEIDIMVNAAPYDLIAASALLIMFIAIAAERMLLRRNIHLAGLVGAVLFRLRRIANSVMLRPGHGIEIKQEKCEDVRMKTLQTFCPITKMKLVDIPEDKLYLCRRCGTYYHRDAILPIKRCMNCGGGAV